MGKRSSFDRIEKDFYRSIDPRISSHLSPHIYVGTKYYEPCCGDGDLINQLDFLNCVGHSDIEKDALSLKEVDLSGAELIITNPPWTRSILHDMIIHFSSLRDTWLLFDADWMHTKQSSWFVNNLCTDIVSVGRLIWIPDTKVQGKDNCAWYKFSVNKNETTKFYGN